MGGFGLINHNRSEAEMDGHLGIKNLPIYH
jgi:hypothetical protein